MSPFTLSCRGNGIRNNDTGALKKKAAPKTMKVNFPMKLLRATRWNHKLFLSIVRALLLFQCFVKIVVLLEVISVERIVEFKCGAANETNPRFESSRNRNYLTFGLPIPTSVWHFNCSNFMLNYNRLRVKNVNFWVIFPSQSRDYIGKWKISVRNVLMAEDVVVDNLEST